MLLFLINELNRSLFLLGNPWQKSKGNAPLLIINSFHERKIGFQGVVSDCFQASCSNNVVIFSIAGKSYQCTSSGQTINVRYSAYSATVTCPDVQHFCRTQRNCPNACSGVGTCRGTTCYCWSGYSGADCSVSN